MNASEIRDLTQDEMIKRLDDFKQEMFNLRFQTATGQLEKPMRVREVRRSIARIMTILNEKKRRVADTPSPEPTEGTPA